MGKEGFEPTIFYENALKASALNHSAICPGEEEIHNIYSPFKIFYDIRVFTIRTLRYFVPNPNEYISPKLS